MLTLQKMQFQEFLNFGCKAFELNYKNNKCNTCYKHYINFCNCLSSGYYSNMSVQMERREK